MIVGGRDFEFDRNEIESRMRGVEPEAIQKHIVEVGGVEYPPKQVVAVMTRWPRTSFTTMEAQRVLRRLGFLCREFNATRNGFMAMPPMGDDEDGERPDAETMKAVADLLVLGQQYEVGITFIPDGEGWTVGYLYGNGGSDLVATYDLHSAAKAALRPLREFIREVGQEHAERMGRAMERIADRHAAREQRQ